MKNLSGHVSQETSYLVLDYPYGRLRCKIRYWLDFDIKNGCRLICQAIQWNFLPRVHNE